MTSHTENTQMTNATAEIIPVKAKIPVRSGLSEKLLVHQVATPEAAVMKRSISLLGGNVPEGTRNYLLSLVVLVTIDSASLLTRSRMASSTKFPESSKAFLMLPMATCSGTTHPCIHLAAIRM